MRFWSRLFGRTSSPPSAGATSPGGGGEPELARLARLAEPDGADVAEALALLRETAGSPAETTVLELLVPRLTADARHEPLRVACARVLAERGESERARALVGASRSVPGLMLAADLAAGGGDLPGALRTVERVLACAVDTPGARERHERWSRALGLAPASAPSPARDGPTLLGPRRTATTLRILREVARGGAGTVYEAADEALGRRVALKIYHRAEGDRDQIAREAGIAIELRGPGVVRIFDADPTAGWLVTEWVERGSLRELLRARPPTELAPLSGWVPALVRAIARVHEQGWVHADLKPGNVLFRERGDPVLADFGSARRPGEPALGATPAYLPPERHAGDPVDPRDDVYALGRVLGEVLAALAPAAAGRELRSEADAGALSAYAELARACLAPAAERPADGRALVAQLPPAPGAGAAQ